MQILNVKNLQVRFGHKPLFEGVNFSVHSGEKIALVGRNGAGKSTLLKIIASELEPEGGTLEFQKNLSVAALPQTVPSELSGSVYDVVAMGLSNIGELLKEYHSVLDALSTNASDALLLKQANLEEKISACDGWLYHQKIQTTISKLDLNESQEVSALSGGLKRRVLLAHALVNNPDILLLDEPTNHLDIDAIEWLETFLKNYKKTIIFISHDRHFMSSIATRILEIDFQTVLNWPGNYDKYCQLKAEFVSAQQKKQALFEKRLSQEETWIRQGIKARRTRNEGRVRRLEALRKEKAQQFKQQGRAKINIQSEIKSGKLVFDVENLSFSYQDKIIIKDFSTIVARGDCVGIVGPNGSGKSTLIKLLLGELPPSSGSIIRGTNLEVAYFDQYRFELDDTLSVIDNVAQGSEKININGKEKHVISYLQDFLFSPERARSKVSVLSGGEKNRLLLAKLFTKSANLIIMDEPTNDLDIDTLELLEEKLADFPGTLLIVSHDRTFLNNVATQLWIMKPDGHIQESIGSYEDLVKKSPEITTGSLAQKQVSIKKPANKIGRKEKKELAAITKKITKLESEIEKLQYAMQDKAFYQQSPEKITAHNQELDRAQSALDACYDRWQELEDGV